MMNATRAMYLVLGLIIAVPASASTINFTGAYDVANWTAIPDFGVINLAGAPSSVTLTSANSGSPNFESHNTDFVFSAFESAIIAFDWNYHSFDVDGPALDPFGWLLNGVFTQLTLPTSAFIDCAFFPASLCTQSGAVAFAVSPGDVFGFRARSADGREGPAVTTVSGFSATTSVVPEPSTLLLVATGVVGVVSRRRQRNRVR